MIIIKKITSKANSSTVINNLNLNRVHEIVCSIYDKGTIELLCDKNIASKYVLRDLENACGKYFICKSKEECVNCAKEYDGRFSLAVSCFAYSNIVLLGEVCLTKNGVTIVAGNAKDIHHRKVYEKAIINTTTTLDDNSFWEVDGVEDILGYVVKHNLYDVIVEFVVYDRPVGVNNEKVLIVELRSEY